MEALQAALSREGFHFTSRPLASQPSETAGAPRSQPPASTPSLSHATREREAHARLIRAALQVADEIEQAREFLMEAAHSVSSAEGEIAALQTGYSRVVQLAEQLEEQLGTGCVVSTNQ